jgi:hypothetical protein
MTLLLIRGLAAVHFKVKKQKYLKFVTLQYG